MGIYFIEPNENFSFKASSDFGTLTFLFLLSYVVGYVLQITSGFIFYDLIKKSNFKFLLTIFYKEHIQWKKIGNLPDDNKKKNLEKLMAEKTLMRCLSFSCLILMIIQPQFFWYYTIKISECIIPVTFLYLTGLFFIFIFCMLRIEKWINQSLSLKDQLEDQ